MGLANKNLPKPPASKAPGGSSAAPEAPTEEPVQVEPSSLDDLTHAEYRVLYEEAAANVLFGKRQQWRLLEYFTLLGLGLVALGTLVPFAREVANFIAGFLSFVAFVTLIVLMMLQSWQSHEQDKMQHITGGFSNYARIARRLKPRRSGNVHRYAILAVMMLYVVVLDVVFVRLLGDIVH